MSILRFRPRDRRQADPFRATPVTHTPPPRFPDPHGIATDETLADIRAKAEAAGRDRPTLVMPAVASAAAPPAGRDALFGAGRLSPLTAPVEADLGGCVVFRDAVHAHFVRHEHAHGAARGDAEGWLPEAARIFGGRFTAELAAIAEQASAFPVPYFAGELLALHPEMLAGDEVIGQMFDQVHQRYEAGFYRARRVFHRADTAGFPAVAS